MALYVIVQATVAVAAFVFGAGHARRIQISTIDFQDRCENEDSKSQNAQHHYLKHVVSHSRQQLTFWMYLLAFNQAATQRFLDVLPLRQRSSIIRCSNKHIEQHIEDCMHVKEDVTWNRRALISSVLAGAVFTRVDPVAAAVARTIGESVLANTKLVRTIGEPVVTGGRLPLTIGFGTCLIPSKDTQRCVQQAIQAGYRLIDTAQRYNNEEGVGKALKAAFASGLKRQDVFVTTKVWIDNMGYESTIKSVRQSASKLGELEGGIDLVLIHWPGEFVRRGDSFAEKSNMLLRRRTWEALEALQQDGVVKQIGISNFGERHLKELLGYAKVKPAVNQFEVHPYNQRDGLVSLCKAEGIAVNSYSPLGGKGNQGQVTDQLLSDPVLKDIATVHRKTVAETILRWHLQRGITPIPKSATKARIEENYNVFDFELSEKEMQAIAKLERGQFAVFDGDQLA